MNNLNRKKFLQKGLVGIGSIIAIPSMLKSCSSNNINPTPTNTNVNLSGTNTNTCAVSPTETAGPFPIKSPADLVKENIVGDRVGLAIQINIKVQNTNNNCAPLSGVLVDIWHCDANGNYSQYSDQQTGDFTSKQFLRGRQTTNDKGEANFISIYPGWYPGRAPHIHVEIKNSGGNSLLISQIALPDNISKTVYGTSGYKSGVDTLTTQDQFFQDSLAFNLTDNVAGDTTKGYTIIKTLKVAA